MTIKRCSKKRKKLENANLFLIASPSPDVMQSGNEVATPVRL